MAAKKKLLFVMIRLNSGGAERSLINLLSLLSPEKYEIDLLLFKREGIFVEQVPPHVRLIEPPRDLKALYGSTARAGRYAPVKVLGTVAGKLMEPKIFKGRFFRWKHAYRRVLRPLPGHYDVAIAYLQGEPTYYVADFVSAGRKLCWVHTDYRTAELKREYDLPAFEKMDGIATISETCLIGLKEAFPELAERMHLIANITSAKAIRASARAFAPAEYGEEEFKILSIGRLLAVKGFDMAIDAAAKLKQKGLRFHWYIMGDGELKAALTAQIAARGVGDCVTLLGTRANPYPYIGEADLVAQTSRWEGKSIVLDEAKMIGVPILCTRYNTAADQIMDGEDGILVPMDAAGIAAGVERMMGDGALREKIVAFQLSHDYDNASELNKYERLIDGV